MLDVINNIERLLIEYNERERDAINKQVHAGNDIARNYYKAKAEAYNEFIADLRRLRRLAK